MEKFEIIFSLLFAFAVGIIFQIILVVIFLIPGLYRKYDNQTRIIRDKDEINRLFCQYSTIFEYHMDPDVIENYAEVEMIVEYRVKPRDPEFKEIINEEIISIQYYHRP